MKKVKKGRGGPRVNAGKPKGTKHKKTLEWEQFGKELLDNGLPRAQRILQRSNSQMFMSYFLKLLEYFKPRSQRIELQTDNPIAIFLKMSPEERSQYISNLKSKAHGTE